MQQDPSKSGAFPPPYPTQGMMGGPAVPPAYPPQPQMGYPPYPQEPQQQGYPVYPTGPVQPGYPAPSNPSVYNPQPQTNYGFYNQTPYYGGTNERPPTEGIQAGGYDSDVEGASNRDNGFQAFSDKAVRRGFIRKVFGILMIQLLVTMGIMSIFVFVQEVKMYAIRNAWMYWVAFAIMLVCMITMACCEGVRRKAPANFIFLGVFTVAEGYLLGTVTASFQVDAVIMAVGICAAVTLALTLFAFQTKYDFTTCGGMLCAMVMVLMVAGIIMAFLPTNKYAMIGYGTAGALIFSMYIVYDIQLMMGGNHKYSISPEEYIFASLSLYLDIINLFMYILMIVGAAKRD